jgi:hypothetical protein
MTSQPYHTTAGPLRQCPQCATYGLSTLLPLTADTVGDDELIEYVLRPRSSWDLENCQLCDFFFKCLPLSYQTDTSHDQNIKSVSRSKEQLADELGVIARVLSYDELDKRSLTIECGLSAPATKTSQSQIVLLRDGEWSGIEPTSAMVDFSMLSGWLKRPMSDRSGATPRRKALGSNRSTRGKPSRKSSWESARLRVHDMELNVIDCTTRRLVRLPLEEQYLTLSYVWGRALGEIKRGTPRRPDSILGSRRLAAADVIGEQDKSTHLSSKLPLTIEDSISVCKALDYRYLWVDRYCIPQKDLRKRARQIQQMDDIYCGLALTLIACAGSGPQHGLPGVSKPRAPCPSVRIGSSGYLQMIPTVHDIYCSTWASRAWTYQEALLAQRRLFFTDQQVYFESSEMVESELTTLAPAVTRVLDPRIYSQATSSAFTGDIYKCIQEYTCRSLSFQSDIMNALLGILTYYGREHGIFHLWGVTFSADTPASIDEPPRKHVITFEESLCWYTTSEPSRREGFPSWSWAGWMSTITWDIYRHDLKPASAPLNQGKMFVEVETNSGQLLGWSEYYERYAELNDSSSPDQLSRFIHIETYVSRLAYTYDSAEGAEAASWTTIGLETVDGNELLLLDLFSNPARSFAHPSHFIMWPPESFLALHLSSWQDHSGTILLVRDRGDYWERVVLLDDETGILERAEKKWMKVRLG